MIAVIDYGCGNLYSLMGSLKEIGAEACLATTAEDIYKADRVILPGVGAFGDAVAKLRASGMYDALISEAEAGKPVLGICLGMQMLFEKSYEYGEHQGLGLLRGEVCPFKGDIREDLKIPHMGWNALNIVREDEIMARNAEGDHMYFVHSFYAKGCENSLIATAEYDVAVPALVGKGKVYGAQFHPEKSGKAGLALLSSFANL